MNSKLKKLKFSIVLPIYNKKLYVLEKVLNSVINQRNISLEIIVCHRIKKNDRVKSLINKIKNNGNNIKYIIQKNRGRSEARNIGLESSEGELCMILNADVVLDDKYLLEKIYKEFKSKKIDALCINSFVKKNMSIYARYVDYSNLLKIENGEIKKREKDEKIWWTEGFVVRLNKIKRLGILFPTSEEIEITAGEDVVFVNKLKSNLKNFSYRKDLEVFHYAPDNIDEYIQQIKERASSIPYLKNKIFKKKYNNIFFIFSLKVIFRLMYCALFIYFDVLKFKKINDIYYKKNFFLEYLKLIYISALKNILYTIFEFKGLIDLTKSKLKLRLKKL